MLNAVLSEINNWFCYDIEYNMFDITEGVLNLQLLDGQYYRIRGSVFNDGLHKFGDDILTDETFTGEVWLLAVPQEIVAIAEKVAKFEIENEPTAKVSESFGGYSYTKATANGKPATWQDVFANQLKPYRKL